MALNNLLQFAYMHLDDRALGRNRVAGRGFVLSRGGICHYIGSPLPIFLRDRRQGARTDGATVQTELRDIVTDGGANLTAIPV
jgi:hypothetical protein